MNQNDHATPTPQDFDKYAENYDGLLRADLGLSKNYDLSIFAGYKVDILKAKLPRPPAALLEFGCGTGRNFSFLEACWPQTQFYGCDVSIQSLEVARKTAPAVTFNAILTPRELASVYAGKVDCVFITNVFHHIPRSEHQAWCNALHDVLAGSAGKIVIFEHNPCNPMTNYIFHHSDADAKSGALMLKPSYCCNLLKNAGFSSIKRDYTMFFLKRSNFFVSLERKLTWLPLGAQYYVIASAGGTA